MHFAFWSIFALLEIHIIYLIDYNIMTWHDFQETKPALDCEQVAGIETEEERIPAKEEDCTTDPVPQDMEMEWDYNVDNEQWQTMY